MSKDFWYLGSPYGLYPQGRQAAHDDIVAVAAQLLLQGILIFCPIAHTHNMSQHLIKHGVEIKDPHRFWLNVDRPLMIAAKGLIVCELEGWEESAGLAEEIEYFTSARKPIVRIHPYDGTIPEELSE